MKKAEYKLYALLIALISLSSIFLIAADFSKPDLTSNYSTEVLQILSAKDNSNAKMDYSGDTNLPVGVIQMDPTPSNRRLQKWNGASWDTISLEAVGTIKMWPSATPPEGYLICDGTAVSRTTYVDLFTALGGNSSPFGLGDGSTTFNLPDFGVRSPLGVPQTPVPAVTPGKPGGTWNHYHTGVRHTHTHSHTHLADPTDPGLGSHVHSIGSHSHVQNQHRHAASDGGGMLQADFGWDAPSGNPQGFYWRGITGVQSATRRIPTTPTPATPTGTWSIGTVTQVTGNTAYTIATTQNNTTGLVATPATPVLTPAASFTVSAPTPVSVSEATPVSTDQTGTSNPPYLAIYFIIKY